MAQLFSAYLDESGDHQGSPAVVVAGYVSSATRWRAFSEEWNARLVRWHIPAFHMTDFENRRGCFASWSNDERESRLDELLAVIKKHTLRSIAYVIRKQQFDNLNLSKPAKKLCGDAYGVAAIGCWYNLSLLLRDPRNNGYVEYIMDSRSRGSGSLLDIYRKQCEDPAWVEQTRLLGLSFKDHRLSQPLQAADILAYEVYKQADRQFGANTRKTRYPLRKLAVLGRQSWHYADDAELQKVAEHLNSLVGLPGNSH